MRDWEQYKVDLPEGSSGEYVIERFTVSYEGSQLHALRAMLNGRAHRACPEGTYTRLVRGRHTIVMSDTPAEIRDHYPIIRRGEKRAKEGPTTALVHGLGIGMVAVALARAGVRVEVVELSEDVIQLVGPTLQERFGDLITIHHGDALERRPAKGERWDLVWHDIWDNICADNLPDMAKLHRRYARRCGWQASWAREECRYQKQRERGMPWA